MWMLLPFVRVAKAYQIPPTLIRLGSGKLALITGPVTDRFPSEAISSLSAGAGAGRAVTSGAATRNEAKTETARENNMLLA